jgi:hypothetical protein
VVPVALNSSPSTAKKKKRKKRKGTDQRKAQSFWLCVTHISVTVTKCPRQLTSKTEWSYYFGSQFQWDKKCSFLSTLPLGLWWQLSLLSGGGEADC